jgi:hypothetical protein
MRDTWPDLDVGDEELGLAEPVTLEHTDVFRRAGRHVIRRDRSDAFRTDRFRSDSSRTDRFPTDVFRRDRDGEPDRSQPAPMLRADTSEPTAPFARPSAMYPMASADPDAAIESAELEATESMLQETTVFDPEAIVRRFETMPPINGQTRVTQLRTITGTAPPPNRVRRAG